MITSELFILNNDNIITSLRKFRTLMVYGWHQQVSVRFLWTMSKKSKECFLHKNAVQCTLYQTYEVQLNFRKLDLQLNIHLFHNVAFYTSISLALFSSSSSSAALSAYWCLSAFLGYGLLHSGHVDTCKKRRVRSVGLFFFLLLVDSPSR